MCALLYTYIYMPDCMQTYISPVLEYASEIWGYKENIECESIHQRACRYYMGVHPKTPILALIGDMAHIPNQKTRKYD